VAENAAELSFSVRDCSSVTDFCHNTVLQSAVCYAEEVEAAQYFCLCRLDYELLD